MTKVPQKKRNYSVTPGIHLKVYQKEKCLYTINILRSKSKIREFVEKRIHN